MSDEIPVGSPPAPPGRHAAPGGWYADPAKPGQERYWDGWQWTRNVREGQAPPQQGVQQQWQQPPQQWDQGQWNNQPQQWQQPQQGWQQPGPGYYYQGQPGPVTADGVPLAGWWWRVLATIIDSVLLYFVTQFILAVSGLSAAMGTVSNELAAYITELLDVGGQPDLRYMMQVIYSSPVFWGIFVVSIAVAVVYSALMLRFTGATVGKLACGLKVVRTGQGRSTEKLPWRVAILRPLSQKLMEQINLLALIDVLFPLWDSKRQSLHDKAASTQVVKIR